MKKFLLIILIILILAISAVIAYCTQKLNKLNYIEVSGEEIEVTEGIEENLEDYRNIALFGIDTRSNTYENGRSDCIIIISINQQSKEIKLVSVYRDTYLNIPKYGLDKVTHAYAYGGPALSMSTLNTNLDLDITEFVTVNFGAVEDIIDEIGGVTLKITDAEATQIPNLKKGGTYTLTGEQALAYGRIRYIDNDYKRTERMRTVIIAAFEKVKKMNVLEINNLIDKLLPEVYTNIKSSEIVSLVPTIASYNISDSIGWPMETKGVTLNKIWYGAPVNLERNVVELHKELFGEEDYTATEKVKEISNKIIKKTGIK